MKRLLVAVVLISSPLFADAKRICERDNSPTAKPNDPLIEIYCARIELAKSNLAKAKADHAFTLTAFDRAHRASSSGAAAMQEYEGAKRDRDSAAAMVEYNKAKVKESEALVEHVDNLLKQGKTDIVF